MGAIKEGMAESYLAGDSAECEVAVNDDTGFHPALKASSATDVRDRIGPALSPLA